VHGQWPARQGGSGTRRHATANSHERSQRPVWCPAWQTIPSWAVVGTADHAIPPALQLAMAENAHAHITEVKAPHLSMISDPGVVTSVILQAVQATT
jgi:pimeloyl-ACP methyl ester carboxylesterase